MRKFRLIPNKLINIGRGADNPHALSLRSMRSYETVEKYSMNTENTIRIDLDVLASILIDGQGMTNEEVLSLKLGDIFQIIETDDVKK